MSRSQGSWDPSQLLGQGGSLQSPGSINSISGLAQPCSVTSVSHSLPFQGQSLLFVLTEAWPHLSTWRKAWKWSSTRELWEKTLATDQLSYLWQLFQPQRHVGWFKNLLSFENWRLRLVHTGARDVSFVFKSDLWKPLSLKLSIKPLTCENGRASTDTLRSDAIAEERLFQPQAWGGGRCVTWECTQAPGSLGCSLKTSPGRTKSPIIQAEPAWATQGRAANTSLLILHPVLSMLVTSGSCYPHLLILLSNGYGINNYTSGHMNHWIKNRRSRRETGDNISNIFKKYKLSEMQFLPWEYSTSHLTTEMQLQSKAPESHTRNLC